MRLNNLGLIFLFCSGSLWPRSQDSSIIYNESDSGSFKVIKPGIQELDVWRPDSVRRFSPVVSCAASLVLPGAGQVYTRHYVKAVFFPALEGILGSMVYFWKKTADVRDSQETWWLQQADTETVALAKSKDREESFLSRQSALDARLSMYSFLAWAGGGYLFNVLDAIGSSNAFRNSKPKNPTTAALLAAVPGLGLGQWYNGSFSKAGMIMMGQVSLGLMAYNSHRLMLRAENNYKRLTAANADTLTKQVAKAYSSGNVPYPTMWSSTRSRSYINRNMYLWYSFFFYGYSIFDAVVDAYLHQYSEKMKIEPDLIIGNNQIYLSLQTTF
jgi:hypothetical protein